MTVETQPTVERSWGKILATEPVSVSLVLLHETNNMMAAMEIASGNSTQFSDLVARDQSMTLEQRRAFLDGLEISPFSHLILDEYIVKTGGYGDPIIERVMAILPAYFKRSILPTLKAYRNGKTTLMEARDVVFAESRLTSLEFMDLIKVLGLTEDETVLQYLQIWEGRLNVQSALAVAQITQWLLGYPLSPQLELVEKGWDEIVDLSGQLLEILDVDETEIVI